MAIEVLRLRSLNVQLLGKNAHILVAASGEVHYKYVMRRKRGSDADALGYRVRAFKRGQDSLRAGQLHHGIEGRRVVLRNILGAPRVMQGGVFRADGSIIQSRRHGMSRRDLPVLI